MLCVRLLCLERYAGLSCAVWFSGLWHFVSVRWLPDFRREYDTYLFNIEVVLKMDVACFSEMLVSNNKTSPCHLNTESQNVCSELTLVNKLINLSCAFSYVKIGKVYTWIRRVNKFSQNLYSNKNFLIIVTFPVKDMG